MKKYMAVAVVVMMVCAFGLANTFAQQTSTEKHGAMMMSTGCPMMAKTDGMNCAMGKDGKCSMDPGKCATASHHGSVNSWPDHGAN